MSSVLKSGLGVVLLLAGVLLALISSLLHSTYPYEVLFGDAPLAAQALEAVSLVLVLTGGALLHRHWWSESPHRRRRRR